MEGFKVDRNVLMCEEDVDRGETPGSVRTVSHLSMEIKELVEELMC